MQVCSKALSLNILLLERSKSILKAEQHTSIKDSKALGKRDNTHVDNQRILVQKHNWQSIVAQAPRCASSNVVQVKGEESRGMDRGEEEEQKRRR